MSCACTAVHLCFSLGRLIEQLQGDGKSRCDESYSSLNKMQWMGNLIQVIHSGKCRM